MKTNIIHVLIIAIILIAGWSFFTILQDFYNADTSVNRNYSVVGKSRQYLPHNPGEYSGRRKYPVYKPSASDLTQGRYYQQGNSLSLKRESKEGSAIYETNFDALRGIESGQLSQTKKRYSESSVLSSMSVSGRLKPIPEIKSVDETLRFSSETTGSVNAEISSMMHSSGNEKKGNAIERGGRRDKKNFRSDIPVGDGSLLLVIMVLFYGIYISLKVNGNISIKKNN